MTATVFLMVFAGHLLGDWVGQWFRRCVDRLAVPADAVEI
jgi:hypothetical protein